MLKKTISLLLIAVLGVSLISCGYKCEICQDKGIVICHTCGGGGEYVCPVCSGSGVLEKSGETVVCVTCKGGRLDCPLCSEGKMDCENCDQ